MTRKNEFVSVLILNRFSSVFVLLYWTLLFKSILLASSQKCIPLPTKTCASNFNNFSIEYILTTGISEMDGSSVTTTKTLENKQAIFVLGNTGSGKTTATQIIAGDLARLYATRSAGSLVIVDNDGRIGAPSTTSKTLIPEYVVHSESKDTFWDCPGFNDNRGSKTDIAAMYFLNHALESTKFAKFLITTTQASLKPGNRIDFPLLSSHLARLFVNIEKFSDSIGLLVTRVASFDPETGEDLADDDLLEQATEFLQNHIEDLKHEEKRHKSENNEDKIVETQIKLKIVNGLLARGSNNKSKIFFVRGPRQCGALSTFPKVVATRKKLAQQYNNNLIYSLITPSDFRYSVQDSTLRDVEQIYIPQISERILQLIEEAVTNLGTKFFEKFYHELSNTSSILSSLEKGHNVIRKYFDDKSAEHTLSLRLASLHTDLISNSYFSSAAKLTELEKQLDFFSTIVANDFVTSSPNTQWNSALLFLQSKINNLQKFYKFGKQTEILLQRKKTQQDLKIYLRRNKGFHLNENNVFELIQNTNIMQVAQDIRDFWNTDLGPIDKSYFLKSVTHLLPTLHECVPIPPTEAVKNTTKLQSLEEILTEGIAEMESEIARGPQAITTERKAIFILGNSGSGKTTATQIMAGNLKSLHATFAEGSTLVILDDDNKIGAPSTRSKTLVPNYVLEPTNSGSVIWDCPGFQDNRGAETDIAAMYFLKHALTLTTSAKFLFTVPQSSVTIGNVRHDFDTMTTHAVRLIRNIESFGQSIGLLVTKVTSYSNLGYIEDAEILNRTVGFLLNYRNDLIAAIETTETRKRNLELKNKLAFVNAILNNAGETSKPRIAFIRGPTDCGTLNTMQELVDSRKMSQTLYNRELSYTPINFQNFNISLSSDTELQVVNHIAPKVYQSIETSTCSVAEKFRNEFFRTFYKTLLTDPKASIEQLHSTYSRLKTFLHSAPNTLLANAYTNSLKTLHRQLNNEISCSKFANLLSLETQLEFYRDVTSEDVIIPQPDASKNTCYQNALEKLSHYSEFYDFCNSTAIQLREYENQEKLQTLQKNNQARFDEENGLQFLFENQLVKGFTISKATTLWNHALLNDKQYLADLIREVMPDMKLECQQSQIDKSKKLLIVTGRIIMVSKAFDKSAWSKAGCVATYVKEIQIVAMETVYFDVDIQERGKELFISVIAPVWEIKLFGSNKREIILNGENAGSHPNPPKSTRKDGRNGVKGLTGITGGAAGTFFGIVGDIVNDEKLFIKALGGNGGSGQNGGDGEEGFQGQGASYNDFPSAYNYDYGTEEGEYINGELTNFADKGHPLGYTQQWRSVRGLPGGPGGNGGTGGNGGAPGAAGRIKLIFTKNNHRGNRYSTDALPGKAGSAGRGGKGGPGGKRGHDHSCLRRVQVVFVWTWALCSNRINYDRAAPGQNGISGQVASAGKPTNKYEPWHVIVQYRRAYLGNFVLPEFLLDLEHAPNIETSMFAISFAEEVDRMEEMFYKSYQNSNLFESRFASYYINFLERIQNFSSSSGNKLSAENKLALNEIYTTVLGKVAGLRRHEFQLNVIKTKPYLDTVVNKINILKTVKKDQEIQQQAITYSSNFLDAIEEATNHISSTVQPAIQDCQKYVEKLNDELYWEIQQFLEDAKVDVERQKELKWKAERAAVFKTIMGVVGIAGAATQFLGPAGMAVGSLISTGNSIAQSLAFGPRAEHPTFKIPIAVTGTLTSANKEYYEKEIKQIRGMAAAVIKATNEADNDKLHYLKKNAIELNNLVKRVEIGVQNNNFIDAMRAKQDTDQLVKKMKNSVFDESQKISSAEKSEKRNVEIIRGLVASMNTVDAVAQIVFDQNSSAFKVKELADAVQQAEQQVKALEQKKEQFYDEFLPAMESMFTAIEADTNSLEGKSRVSQMVKGWEIKTMLRKMRHYIKQFTTGISVSEEFQVCLDLLDEALTLLLGLYDQIENFKDKIDLANYIANVNKANTQSTGNKELDLALHRISGIVQGNLMLEEYQKAKHAFKQWVFPFANLYINDRHAVYSRNSNLNDIVNLYTKEIEHLQSELAVYQATTVSHDMSQIFEIFSSDTVSTEPFYVWKNQNWRESIGKLLSGEPIKLKADVDMHGQQNVDYFLHKAAIKFKTVELKFRARNPNLQAIVDQRLKYFRMKLEHTGQSLYKVLGKHYIINGRPQTYRYSFEKNHNGHISRNGVQYKVQGGDVDYLLSPYTWWVLQLIDSKPDDQVGFPDLAEFVDEIDLELEGEGVYLDESSLTKDVLDRLNLDEHYESVDPKLIDVRDKEDLYGFC